MSLDMKKSLRPKRRPDDGGLDPKVVEERSTREMKKGGKVKKMAGGGMCRGMGAAKKGGKYKG